MCYTIETTGRLRAAFCTYTRKMKLRMDESNENDHRAREPRPKVCKHQA